MHRPDISDFEKRIGYSFQNKDLLLLAFTHSSYANEHKKGRNEYNERLEFLGDAALDLVVSKYIYIHFPEMPEGELTKLRAGLVCESSLAKFASQIELGSYLLLGKGEESTGGRERESILADAFESVIGAICIDSGMEAVERYVLSLMADEVENMAKYFKTIDCKTHLQEVIQKSSKQPLNYRIVSESGPDHDKVFVSEVYHEGRLLGQGEGRSKKEAEQSAANDALLKLQECD